MANPTKAGMLNHPLVFFHALNGVVWLSVKGMAGACQ